MTDLPIFFFGVICFGLIVLTFVLTIREFKRL